MLGHYNYFSGHSWRKPMTVHDYRHHYPQKNRCRCVDPLTSARIFTILRRRVFCSIKPSGCNIVGAILDISLRAFPPAGKQMSIVLVKLAGRSNSQGKTTMLGNNVDNSGKYRLSDTDSRNDPYTQNTNDTEAAMISVSETMPPII